MFNNFLKAIKNNSIVRYIFKKFDDILSYFHIPTILGHNDLSNNDDLNNKEDNSAKDDNKDKKSKNKTVEKMEVGFSKVIEGFDSTYDKYKNDKIEESVIRSSRGPLKFGLYLVLGFFGTFFVWMLFAQIDGSVIAQGQVVFAQNKQNIQHQTGGIIKSILVKEGDLVHYGQVLLTLHDSDLRANYNMTYNKVFTLKATRSRLISEREESKKIIFGDELSMAAKENKDLQEILKSQERLYRANLSLYHNKINIIHDRQQQLEGDIKNIRSQEILLKQRIKYVEEQIRGAEKLLVDGNVSKSRLFELKSQRDALMQENQRFLGAISNSEGQIANLSEEELIATNNRIKEIEDNLKEIETNITLEQERLNALQDSLNKNVIKAPIDGVVNNLKYKNSGEVFPSGVVIMEIVPQDDYLIVEAKLMAKEINSLLSTGLDLFNYNHQDINHLLDAKINLVSYSNRRYRKLKGSVFYVASDVATDPRYGYSYYLLKVMISKKELEYATSRNMKLFPGMPAEIYVLTEPRTPFSYLISPITASMGRAFIDS